MSDDLNQLARQRSSHWRNMRNGYRRIFWKNEVTQTHPEDGEEYITPAARKVLTHLRGFCRADESCVVFGKNGQVDTHATAVLEGRREVWLKIVQLLHVSDEQLIQIMHQNHYQGEYNYGNTNEFKHDDDRA